MARRRRPYPDPLLRPTGAEYAFNALMLTTMVVGLVVFFWALYALVDAVW